MTEAALSDRDRQQLTDLVVEHAWLLDHGRWHQVADLFLADGAMVMGEVTLTGRAALLAWADVRATKTARHTRHQCTNIRLHHDTDQDGYAAATGTVMLVLHASEDTAPPRIEFVGEYRDSYRRDADGQWRFARRELVALQAPAL